MENFEIDLSRDNKEEKDVFHLGLDKKRLFDILIKDYLVIFIFRISLENWGYLDRSTILALVFVYVNQADVIFSPEPNTLTDMNPAL